MYNYDVTCTFSENKNYIGKKTFKYYWYLYHWKALVNHYKMVAYQILRPDIPKGSNKINGS